MRFALYSKKLRPNDHSSGKILTTKRVIIAGVTRSGPRRSGLKNQPTKPTALRARPSCCASAVADEAVVVIYARTGNENGDLRAEEEGAARLRGATPGVRGPT